MSTKIYNGYRFTGPAGSRPDPFALVADVRTALTGAYRGAYTRTLVRLACLHIDRVGHVPGAERRPRPLTHVGAEIRDAHLEIERTGHRNPEFDFSARLTLLSAADPAGPLYGLLSTEQDSYVEAFATVTGVQPYPYWNNTDKPGDVSDAEWETRRVLWNRLIPHTGPSSLPVLRWELFGPHGLLTPRDVEADLAAAIPDRITRVEAVARRLVPIVDLDGWTPRAPGDFPPLRDVDVITAERAAAAMSIEPQLADITVADLWGDRAA